MLKFLLLACSSFGLGALHALEPGHGKTVVGAYLVGSKGRVSDAVLLGIVVTLTHSGSVILLGILSTVAAAIFVPETVQRVLEVVSGLLVVGVGGWMLAVRLRQAKAGATGHGHEHPHAHPHEEHNHPHPHEEHAHPHPHEEHAHPHPHADHVEPHEEHDHPHPHPHEDHDHPHDHDHDGHGHSHVIPGLAAGERPSLGQLIALGISGGIVPCPAALAVLLAAVSYGQFLRGLSLVIIFSIGMAAVLVAIGIMMVKAAGVAGRYVTAESRWVRWVPVGSAALITVLGLALTVRAVVGLG